jgi:hypothetical protein
MADTPDHRGNGEFCPGDSVYWWKRHNTNIEYPFRAMVVSMHAKRVTIEVEDLDGGTDRIVRHVAAERLQPIAVFYSKAMHRFPATLEPAASWGRFTLYLEVGEDLRTLRNVHVFENGRMLSYDRNHWVDDFGMLGDGKINRKRKQGPWQSSETWWSSEEIKPEEFERIWEAARSCPTWREQVATAQMGKLGEIPIWFTIKGWRPPLRSK